MKRSPVVTACRVGYEAGIYEREGRSKSGDPFKYFLKVEKCRKVRSRRDGRRDSRPNEAKSFCDLSRRTREIVRAQRVSLKKYARYNRERRPPLQARCGSPRNHRGG